MAVCSRKIIGSNILVRRLYLSQMMYYTLGRNRTCIISLVGQGLYPLSYEGVNMKSILPHKYVCYQENFKGVEFDAFRFLSGSNSFVLRYGTAPYLRDQDTGIEGNGLRPFRTVFKLIRVKAYFAFGCFRMLH